MLHSARGVNVRASVDVCDQWQLWFLAAVHFFTHLRYAKYFVPFFFYTLYSVQCASGTGGRRTSTTTSGVNEVKRPLEWRGRRVGESEREREEGSHEDTQKTDPERNAAHEKRRERRGEKERERKCVWPPQSRVRVQVSPLLTWICACSRTRLVPALLLASANPARNCGPTATSHDSTQWPLFVLLSNTPSSLSFSPFPSSSLARLSFVLQWHL